MNRDPSAFTLHRPPALLVSEVLNAGADGGQVLLLNQHGLDVLQLIEGCAQAIAVVQGAYASDLPPQPGVLAAVTTGDLCSSAHPGDTVMVTVVRGAGLGQLRQWSVVATCNGDHLVVATITTAIKP